MSEAGPEHGLVIEAVDRLPLSAEKLVVRVSGRWRGRSRPDLDRVSLVVEEGGRRHRFPAIPQPRRPRLARAGGWTGSFAVPLALEHRLDAHAALMLETTRIPLPAAAGNGAAGAGPAAVPAPEAVAGPGEPEPDVAPPAVSGVAEDASVAALHAELRARAAEEASLRGRLAGAEAQLRAALSAQSRMEEVHIALRGELDELRGLIEGEDARRSEIEGKVLELAAQVARLEDERGELRAELAASQAAREAAVSEAAGLRRELERMAGELAEARVEQAPSGPGLDEAEALLAEARALRARLDSGNGAAAAEGLGGLAVNREP